MRSAEWDTSSVLVRAFCVLDAFVPEGGEMGLSELVRRTGLPKATVHRLATQLVDIGALEKMGDRYRPGLRLFELGSVVVRHRRLRDSALPLMEDLYEATHETVHLGIPDGLDVLYLEKIVGPRGSPVSTRVGTRKPLYCTALGKAMLAFSPGELLRAVLAGGLTATLLGPSSCLTCLWPRWKRPVKAAWPTTSKSTYLARLVSLPPFSIATGWPLPPCRSPARSPGSIPNGTHRPSVLRLLPFPGHFPEPGWAHSLGVDRSTHVAQIASSR